MIAETLTVEWVSMVYEFPDVFPIDFLRLPLEQDINFAIEIESGTKPISIPPYRMALDELST